MTWLETPNELDAMECSFATRHRSTPNVKCGSASVIWSTNVAKNSSRSCKDGQNELTILLDEDPTFRPLSSQLLKAVLCSAAPKPIVGAHRDRKRCVARADVFFRLLNDEREDTMKMLLHYDVTSTRDTGVTSCFSMSFWMAAAVLS